MSASKPENNSQPQPPDEFLTRWSRLKQAARNTDSTASPPIETVDSATSSPLVELTDKDMPPLASLNEDSDYRGFLSPKVSEALRKQALRKLFHSPVFNVRDGLDDYDEEYTQFAKLGDIVTADMRHQLEVEAQRLRELAKNELVTDAQATNPDNEIPQTATTETDTLATHAHNAEVES